MNEWRALLDGLNAWEDTGLSGKGCSTTLLSQLDPEGCYMRKCHRLRRRVYRNEGPNAA